MLGAIAARFAIAHGDRVAALVLVDTLGLAPFRPDRRRASRSRWSFLARPTERTFDRFMRQCSYDLDGLRAEMGEFWQPFVAYGLGMARAPEAKAAMRSLMPQFAMRAIPAPELARITVPTTLVRGRHDRATRLRVAERTSARCGRPLHVVEDCADDPPRDRPAAFLAALRVALRRSRALRR